ncbi:MAG: prepilin-type N-terminal cleavage/methylation domain-containing protein, partial [Candidatus Sumerlaeia bacterium]|nr:prepilin-type N-terminal cleavage/methylation domain-containing protein [Candidatus Sumerlaeia bacterium]
MTKLVHNKKTRGFTLIELLIVVAIIAILAAIAVPNFLEAQTRSKVSRVKSDMRTATTAIELYHLDNNAYPTGFGLSVSDTDRWRFGLWLLSTPIAYV